MNLTGASLKSPFAVIALVLPVAALGSFAFFRTPTDLFPDTTPPPAIPRRRPKRCSPAWRR